MNTIIINEQEFKLFRDTWYYVNKLGDVYSVYSKTLLKPMCRKTRNKMYKYIDILNKTTHKQQHIALHRIIAEVWMRPLKEGEQVNHINDNSLDNRVENLHIGDQKDNIKDCYNNGHKISSIKYITVKDKENNNAVLTFCPLSKFIEYDGHSSKNGSIKRWFIRQWFNKRYEVLDYGNIKNLEHFRSVTTMADECKPVGLNLSLSEVHSIVENNNEEIV